MALTQTQVLPAQFIQDVGQDYAKQLTAATAAPLPTAQFAPSVAGQTALQQQATTLAGQIAPGGIAAYQPYLTGAATAGQAPGAAPLGLEAYGTMGGAAGLLGAGANLAAAEQAPTAGSIAEYMSPYQSQVIQTTLDEFDREAAARQQAISDAAVGVGGYGGGRHGVAEAEYMTGTARNRAMLQAGLEQQGYGQAQQARQQDYLNRMGLGAAQQGLGQYQTGLGTQTQALAGQDIATAGRVGAAGQAQTQAELDAIREANRMAAYEPIERLGMYGTGVTGLMGGYPGQYQFTTQPGASPLQSALGIASTAGGVFGNIYGEKGAPWA